jgi:hypothetical protein
MLPDSPPGMREGYTSEVITRPLIHAKEQDAHVRQILYVFDHIAAALEGDPHVSLQDGHHDVRALYGRKRSLFGTFRARGSCRAGSACFQPDVQTAGAKRQA